jgi:hypothetical protein
MSGVSLNQNEKRACNSLHLNNSATRLNSFVVQNHRNIERAERQKLNKNNALLEGLGKKKVEIVKVQHMVKCRDHADTALLRMILKMIPITPIHTKPFSKLLRTSKRLADDGCLFLFEQGLIHRSGQNRYKAK